MYKTIYNIVFLSIFLLTANSVFSQNTFYYNQYKSWSPELENVANNSNNAMAIVSLGSCYDRAAGVNRDREKAFKLFEKAYSINSDPMKLGAYNLALYYACGYVTPVDNQKAEQLLKEVIQNDNTFGPAYMTLAPIYEIGGNGVNKDDTKAYETWQKLANLGDAFGQLKTGSCYKNGVGVTQDKNKAEEYFRKSAEKGNEYAMYELANIYIEKGKYVEAINLLEKSGLKGFNVAYHSLGDMYYNGKGVTKSYEKAYDYFNKGIGFSACKYRMALMLREGIGVSKDVTKSKELLILSANEGMDRAQYQLGCDYYNGNYEKNYSLAVKYFEMALQSKYLPDFVKGDICRKLAACYRFGRGVEQSEETADDYNVKGAEFGNPDSKKIKEWLNETPKNTFFQNNEDIDHEQYILNKINDESFLRTLTIEDLKPLADKGYAKVYAPLAELYCRKNDFDNAHKWAISAANSGEGVDKAESVVLVLYMMSYYENGKHGGLSNFMEKYVQRDENNNIIGFDFPGKSQ